MLMTTDPGDIVLDPTCGSGTTAYVAEEWGRRWITVDTSRVPLALARQRLLTATFPYYQLHEPARGPSGGFVYSRRRNRKNEEIGGVVPHIGLGEIADDGLPTEIVLVDRPDFNENITRVTGPFCVEATIPTPLVGNHEDEHSTGQGDSTTERLLDVLRRNPVLQLGANRSLTLSNVQPLSQSLTLSAEAAIDGHAICLGVWPREWLR